MSQRRRYVSVGLATALVAAVGRAQDPRDLANQFIANEFAYGAVVAAEAVKALEAASAANQPFADARSGRVPSSTWTRLQQDAARWQELSSSWYVHAPSQVRQGCGPWPDAPNRHRACAEVGATFETCLPGLRHDTDALRRANDVGKCVQDSWHAFLRAAPERQAVEDARKAEEARQRIAATEARLRAEAQRKAEEEQRHHRDEARQDEETRQRIAATEARLREEAQRRSEEEVRLQQEAERNAEEARRLQDQREREASLRKKLDDRKREPRSARPTPEFAERQRSEFLRRDLARRLGEKKRVLREEAERRAEARRIEEARLAEVARRAAEARERELRAQQALEREAREKAARELEAKRAKEAEEARAAAAKQEEERKRAEEQRAKEDAEKASVAQRCEQAAANTTWEFRAQPTKFCEMNFEGSTVSVAIPGTLPPDGKWIAEEREYHLDPTTCTLTVRLTQPNRCGTQALMSAVIDGTAAKGKADLMRSRPTGCCFGVTEVIGQKQP